MGGVIPTEETTLTTTETEELEVQEEVAYVPHKVTVSSNALDLVDIQFVDECISVSANSILYTVENKDIAFTLDLNEKAPAHYRILNVTYAIGSAEAIGVDKMETGIYVLAKAIVNQDVKIYVTVTDGKYVVPEYVPQPITVSSNELDMVDVQFTDGCTTVSSNGVRYTEDYKDVMFNVALKGNAAQTHKVAGVTYIVGRNEAVVAEKTENVYTVPYEYITEYTQIYVTIAESGASETAKTVVFADAADHVSYEVITNEGVALKEGKKSTYTVAAGTSKLAFKVTASDNYEAVIDYDGDYIDATVTQFDGYDLYEIAAKNLRNNQTIRISEQKAHKAVNLFFNEDEVAVSNAMLNGAKFWDLVALGDELEETPARQAYVPYGSKLTITVEAWGNTALTGIKGTGVKTQTLKDLSSYTFTVEVKEDVNVEISSKAKTSIYVYEEDYVQIDEMNWENVLYPLETEKNAYILDNVWYKNYVAFVYKGNDFETPVKVKDAKLLQGKTPVKWGTRIWDNEEITISGNCTPGKTYKLNVTTVDGEETSTTLKTLPLISKASVKGVKGGKLAQIADSMKEYDINITPKGALNTVGVLVEGDEKNVIGYADVSNGKLLLVTTYNVGSATLKLYDKAGSYPDSGYYKYINGGEFTVNVTAPKMTTVKPTVKLAGSTNTSFTLNLGAKGIETPNNGKVWYKVVAAPVETYEGLGTVTKYFAYEGASQTATFSIGDVAEGSIPQALKYNIEVSMVQTADENHPEAENAQILFETATNKVAKLNNAATKKPYYETKLKLKKGTTTIFTGQTDVVVATPTFSKLTSYTQSLDVKVYDRGGDEVVQEDAGVYARYEGGKILVSVADNAWMGPYKIVATADTKANTKTVSATVDFKVVFGINWIELNTPDTIYKVDKKAATFKVDYTPWNREKYDENSYNLRGVYKNKVNLSIVDEYGDVLADEHPLKKYVSVKNGKVTIAKNYVIDPYNATFCIKAEAADYEGNKSYTISNPITITNQPLELGEVVLVNDTEDYSGYEIIARSGDTVSIDKAEDSFVRMLKKGVAEKDMYNDDDFIDEADVTYKCSNKSVNFDSSEGSIDGIQKEVKNVKFTMTAKDGSGAKAELKLNLTGTQKECVLRVMNDDTYEDIITTTTDNKNYSGTFYGVKRTPLSVQVETVDGEQLWGKAAPKCKVTFQNAKTAYSYTKNGYYYYTVEPTADTVVATLEYGNTKKVYTLTNGSFNDTTKTLESLEIEGTIHQYVDNTVNLVLPEEYNGQYVVITADQVKWEKDKNYRNFTSDIEEIDWPIQIMDNKAELTISNPQKTGSYKFYVTVGTLNEDGKFSAASTLEKEITLKVNKVKLTKNTAKLAASYTIDLSQGTSTILKYTNKKDAYADNLYNVNDNGTPNNFADYFEVSGTTLKLKDNLTEDQKAYLLTDTAKKDLTGWIEYSNDNGMQQTKIKVTLKGSFAGSGNGGNGNDNGGNEGPYHFEILVKSFQSTYWQAAVSGISKACAELGVSADINGPANESDIADQVAMLNAAIEENPDGIGLAACDTYAVMDSLTLTLQKGIPVVCFDTPIANTSAVKANVTMDNANMGAIAADKIYAAVAGKIAVATTDAPVRIGEINQDATSVNIQQRGVGFINEMIKLCNKAGKKVKVEGNTFYINAATGAVTEGAEVIIEVAVPATPNISVLSTESNKIMTKEDTIAIWGSNQTAAEGIITANMTLNVLGAKTERQIVAAGADAGVPQKTEITSGRFIGAVSTNIMQEGYECIKTLNAICQGNQVSDTMVDGLWYDTTNMNDETVSPNLYD